MATYYGGSGNDTNAGTTGNDISYGGSGNDTLSGGSGIDTLSGGSGYDSLTGDSGDDQIVGGSGNDTVYGDQGNDYADLGAGEDSFGSWASESGNDTVYGGDGNDYALGGFDNDLIYGGAGNDTFSGGGGSDSLYGGTGNDAALIFDDHNYDFFDMGENVGDADKLIFSNFASNSGLLATFTGSDAGNYSYGGGYAYGDFLGVEQISGTEYADTLNADADTDGVSLWGNSGNDSISGGSGNDWLEGGSGEDTLYFGAGRDMVYGGTGNDLVDDHAGAVDGGNSYVDAGDGDDTVWSGGGADSVYGGAGNDLVSAEDDNDLVSGGGGNDLLFGGAGEDTLDGGQGADYVDGEWGNDNLDLIIADFANDDAYGGAGNDTLTSRFDFAGGSDFLFGGDGRDVLAAGADDWVYGGEGGDDFDRLDLGVSPVGVAVTLTDNGAGTASGGGATLTFAEIENINGTAQADTISGAADSWGMSYSTAAGNDSITGGSGADTVDAGTGNDTVYGGAGNDSLSGGQGIDLLSGGAGDDSLDGGADSDIFQIGEGEGTDTIIGGETSGDLDSLVFSGQSGGVFVTYSGSETGNYAMAGGGQGSFTQIEAVLGTSFADTVDGSASATALNISAGGGNDLLQGSAAADHFTGGDGDDTEYGGDGDDSLNGDQGNDQLWGGAGNDWLFTGSGDDVAYGEAGDDYLSGMSGSALLDGGSGNDSLFGGADNDTLRGGEGKDSLSGGSGLDRFEFVRAGGGDAISDFEMQLLSGKTTDQLDVSALRTVGGQSVRGWDVTISDDGYGNALLVFPEGESILLQGVAASTVAQPGMLAAMGVPCFASGTRIETPTGPRRVEGLRAGDLVRLADGGFAPVLWAGRRMLTAATLSANARLRPVRLLAGSHGAKRDLVLSTQHAVAITVAGKGRALIRAGHLAALNWGARSIARAQSVSYHHILLPRHALMLAHGCPVESLYPGPQALSSFRPDQRASLTQVLHALYPPVPGLSRATAYGARCLPLLSLAEARIWHSQHSRLSFSSGNRAFPAGFFPKEPGALRSC